MGDITQLLDQARSGRSHARDELFTRVYDELRQLARAKLARESTFTQLDTLGLVHEAYLRLVTQDVLPGSNRRQFFVYAASVMRSVIVDCARERKAQKRGSGEAPITLATDIPELDARPPDIEALDAALQRLAQVDGRVHQIVEMRYFAGFSVEEICDTLELSEATVNRDWKKARAFLFKELRD